MTHAWMRIVLLVWLLSQSGGAWAVHRLTLGVFAFRPPAVMEPMMRPLADYIAAGLDGHQVDVVYLDQAGLMAAVQSRQVDLVFTNPVHFMLLRSVGSLNTLMATAITQQDGQAVKSLGGVIIARAGVHTWQRLADLDGLRIGIPGRTFLGGYQAQAYEFRAQNLPFPAGHVEVVLGGHDDVVLAVLDGRVDVGFVRTGIIERMRDANGPVLPRLHVINAQTFAGFPYAISTRLYPEWPVVALAHVDDELVRQVASRLLALPSDHPAAVAAGLGGFAPLPTTCPSRRWPASCACPPTMRPRCSTGMPCGCATSGAWWRVGWVFSHCWC